MFKYIRVMVFDGNTTVDELWEAGHEFGFDKPAIVTSCSESRHGVTERLSTVRSELEKRLPRNSPLRDQLLTIAPLLAQVSPLTTPGRRTSLRVAGIGNVQAKSDGR